MQKHYLTSGQIKAFERYLHQEERAPATVTKYLRDLWDFMRWLGDKPVTKEAALDWKESLLAAGLTAVTVNGKISALNGLLSFIGWKECRIKFLRLQRRMFRERNRELTRNEYLRLLNAAREMGKERLELLMEAICSTGIRVSEVQYLTVEAARNRQAVINLKGKIRTILLGRSFSPEAGKAYPGSRYGGR